MANKERLLSASKLVTVLAKKYRNGMIHYDDLMATIADVPTVDAVEVVHGRWVNPYINRYGHPCHCCSVCGFKASHQDKNYCPNCGAKMGRERNDSPFLFTRRNEIR